MNYFPKNAYEKLGKLDKSKTTATLWLNDKRGVFAYVNMEFDL